MTVRTRSNLAALAALAVLLQAVPPSAAHADDKQSIVSQIIPKEISDILDNAKEIIGFANGIGEIVDAAGVIGKLLGLSSEGVPIDQQFASLNKHLDQVQNELSREGHAAEASRRYGIMRAAVYSLMQAMANGERADDYLVRADADSFMVMSELESAFSTPWSSGTVADQVARADCHCGRSAPCCR